MTRVQNVVLSAVCCAFGALSLTGPEDLRGAAYAVNVVLALAAFFFAGEDLRARGWRWGYLISATYVLPLVGTLAYLAASSRPRTT